MRLRSVLVLAGLAAAGILAVLVATGRATVPDRWNPWAPLTLEAPPDLFFRVKLARASADPGACRALLDGSTLRFRPLPDRTTGPGCGFANAVRVERTSVQVGAPLDLTCRAALSLTLWEMHGLQPTAQAHFGQPVARVQHYGSYACRDIGGGAGGRRSQHATADALDLAAFVLADGRRIVVAKHWDDAGAEGAFLRDVFQSACRFFDAALGPGYDAAHRDHFHFDRGGLRACR